MRGLGDLRDAFFPLRLREIALLLLLVLAVAVPYPYGAILGGGSASLKLLAFLASAAALASDSRGERPLGAAWIPAAAVLAVAALGVAQLVPLPPGLLGALSPASAEIHAGAAALLAAAGRASALPARISIAPTETTSATLLVLAYAAVFLTAARVLESRSARRILVTLLLASALAQVVLGTLGEGVSAGRIHGAFVNPNHLAAYLEIALALAFGALLREVLIGDERASGSADRAEAIERRLVPLASRVLLWGAIAAGIGLTGSRGGMLAAGVTTLALVALAVSRRAGAGAALRPWVRRGIPLALLGGVLFAAAAAGEGALLRFLATDPRDLAADSRVAIYRTSIAAFREFPVVGSGLGTFREAFRRVQPRELPGLLEQAHCDGLQLLVTGGLAGFVLGAAAVATLFVGLARAWRRQPHREESALVLAGIGALISLTLHGLVDFGFSIPAIPATLALILGAAWAAGRDERSAQKRFGPPEGGPSSQREEDAALTSPGASFSPPPRPTAT